MNVRNALFAALAALLLSAGAFAVACGGGGGELTLEEFFEEVQALQDEFDSQSDEVGSEFETLSEDSEVGDVVDLLRRQGDLIDEFTDGLDGLNPPDEATAVQEEAVQAGRDVIEAFEGLLDDAEGAESLDALFALFDENEAFQEASNRFDQACLDAEELAADNDITVDLNCGGE